MSFSIGTPTRVGAFDFMETTVAVDLFQSCWMGGIIGGVITVWTAIGGTEIGFVRAKAGERTGAGRGGCPTVRSMKGVTLGVAATGGAAGTTSIAGEAAGGAPCGVGATDTTSMAGEATGGAP